jgi:choline transport protein
MADDISLEKIDAVTRSADDQGSEELVNASGHRQELERNFSLLSICAIAVTTGNTWIAQGGSVVGSAMKHDISLC